MAARRRALPWTSLRTNAVLMVLAMLVLPQAIVVGWSAMERDIGGKLQWSARETAEDAADALKAASSEGLDPALTEARLDEVAAHHTARIRVVRSDGTVRFDVDHDQGTDVVHQVGTLFFGPDGAPDPPRVRRDARAAPAPPRDREGHAVARRQGPAPAPPPLPGRHRARLRLRREAAQPRPRCSGAVSTLFRSLAPPPGASDVDTGCRTSPAFKLLVCHARAGYRPRDGVEAIYAQESSRRAVRALYDLRYQLLRLSLVMLPFALGFSWWMGRRMVRPIEWLRERVLEKARNANPRADLDPPRGDEVADLAEAFNGLLGSLDERRRANEAFVADLVHEFKNPVAAIRTCAETLDSGGVDESGPRASRRSSPIRAHASTRSSRSSSSSRAPRPACPTRSEAPSISRRSREASLTRSRRATPTSASWSTPMGRRRSSASSRASTPRSQPRRQRRLVRRARGARCASA